MKNFILIFCILLTYSLYPQSETWYSNSGPNTGTINDIYYDGERLYAATGSFGIGSIYLSDNMGESWFPSLDSLAMNISFESIFGVEGKVFAGTKLGKIIVSNDNGINWEVSLNLQQSSITDFAYQSGRLYAISARAGAYISDDLGDTWDELILGDDNFQSSAIVVNNGLVMISDNNEGLHRSTDNGDTWQIINDFEEESNYFTSLYFDGENYYCGNFRNSYYSDDDGLTWNRIETLGLGTAAIAFTHDDKYLYAGVGSKIYGLDKNSGNWKNVSDSTFFRVTFLDKIAGKIIFGFNHHPAFISDDNMESSEFISTGISNTLIRDIAVDGDVVAAGVNFADFGYPWISTDRGETWRELTNGIAGIGVETLILRDNLMIVGTNGGGVYRSTDRGENFERVTDIEAGYISEIGIKDNIVIAGSEGFTQGSYISHDNGETWDNVEGLSKSNLNGLKFTDDAIYAAVQVYNGLYESKDDGDTWQQIIVSEDPAPLPYYLEAQDETIILGSAGRGFWLSNNSGEDWQKYELPVELPVHVYSAEIYADTIYFATEKGFYKMHVQGGEISRFGAEPTNWISYDNIVFDDNTFFAGSNGYGVWRYNLLPSTVENTVFDEEKMLYPNLADQFITIKDINGDYSIRNLTGELVQSGYTYNGKINISELAPGMYMIRFNNNNTLKFIKE